MQLVVTQKLGKLYLNLGLEQFKQCDYDKAKEWYQKALKISETEPTDYLLHEKTLTGLGI